VRLFHNGPTASKEDWTYLPLSSTPGPQTSPSGEKTPAARLAELRAQVPTTETVEARDNPKKEVYKPATIIPGSLSETLKPSSRSPRLTPSDSVES
jgi:hypothetical protein